MKKVVIVVDPTYSSSEISELEGLKKMFGRSCKLHTLKAVDSLEALQEVSEAISKLDETVIVMFKGGTKTSLLNSLPCQRLDLGYFMTKLKEAVGGIEDASQKALVCTLYAAGVVAAAK